MKAWVVKLSCGHEYIHVADLTRPIVGTGRRCTQCQQKTKIVSYRKPDYREHRTQVLSWVLENIERSIPIEQETK